jgi:hypothetical protein
LAPLASKMSHGHLHALPGPLPESPMSMMRVLVAFEDLRSLYRELLVKAILNSRPTLNVRSASLEELADMLLHFDPHVVVCSHPTGDPDEARLAQLCLDGEHWLTKGHRFRSCLRS